MSRHRAPTQQVHLYCYAEAARDMGKLAELAKGGGETRARLLAEFEVLNREVLTLGGGGVPRRLMAWEAMANELQREASLAATERGVVLDAEAEVLEEFDWTLEEIELAIDTRNDLTLVHRDDSTIVYATDEGEQVGWVRAERHHRWRYAEEDLTGGAGFTRREETNEPEGPPVSIRVLPPLEEEGTVFRELPDYPSPTPEIADLLEQLAEVGRGLRVERDRDGTDLALDHLIDSVQEDLEAQLAQAGQGPDELRALVARGHEALARVRTARKTNMQVPAGASPAEVSTPGGEAVSPPGPAPEPDAPVSPAETPGEPEHAGPPVSGNEGGAETAPAPPPAHALDPSADPAERSLAAEALEDEREQLQNYAAEIQEVAARDRAFEVIAAARSLPELATLRGRVTATLQQEARVRAQVQEHTAQAQAKHEQAKAEKVAPPKESALARMRREQRQADQATKDLPHTKELRRHVLELIREIWPAQGTAPRDLISEVEESGYQALTKTAEQLQKQAEARRAKAPAVAPQGRVDGPPVEGW